MSPDPERPELKYKRPDAVGAGPVSASGELTLPGTGVASPQPSPFRSTCQISQSFGLPSELLADAKYRRRPSAEKAGSPSRLVPENGAISGVDQPLAVRVETARACR